MTQLNLTMPLAYAQLNTVQMRLGGNLNPRDAQNRELLSDIHPLLEAQKYRSDTPSQFILELLNNSEFGPLALVAPTGVAPNEQAYAYIQKVIELYRQRLAGNEPSKDTWENTHKAAEKIQSDFNIQTRNRLPDWHTNLHVQATEIAYFAIRATLYAEIGNDGTTGWMDTIVTYSADAFAEAEAMKTRQQLANDAMVLQGKVTEQLAKAVHSAASTRAWDQLPEIAQSAQKAIQEAYKKQQQILETARTRHLKWQHEVLLNLLQNTDPYEETVAA